MSFISIVPESTDKVYSWSLTLVNLLTVSFEKNAQSNIDAESYLRREFAISNFSRSFMLKDNIDDSKITSKLENGILNIILPKFNSTESKIKVIDIQ